jgi:hypothetical protein
MLRAAWLSLAVFFTLAMSTPAASCQASGNAPAVTDVDGNAIRLFGPDTKATVLYFVTDDCPIANSYMPEMNRIVASYTPQHVAFFAVYTDPSVSDSAIRQHASDYSLHMPLIADRAHVLVRRAGATVTPEVAVFAPGGRLVYRGRIDDWYVEIGKQRIAPTQRYLRQALDEVLHGQPVAITRVRPVGCSIVP